MGNETHHNSKKKRHYPACVRRMIESHSILGISFAAMIYVIAVTGALTLFVDEITLWENHDAPMAEFSPSSAYQNGFEQLWQKKDPENSFSNMLSYGPHEFSPALLMRLNAKNPEGELVQTNWVADPQTGDILRQVEAPLAEMIEELHVALHLPRPWGRYIVGLLGVCMFSLVMSGILAHPSIIKDAFKLRLSRRPRMAWTDVHNRLSVWGLPFHLVLTFTGGFLGLAGLTILVLAYTAYNGDTEKAIASISEPQPIEGAVMHEPPYVDAMIDKIRNDNPEKATQSLDLIIIVKPDNDGGTTSISMSEEGLLDNPVGRIFRNNGEFLATYGGEGAPAGIRALAMMQPLHYGTFGGYAVKFLYFIMALALSWVTASGMKIWFSRRQDQGRATPRLAAAWQGMTMGLSVSLAAITLLRIGFAMNAGLLLAVFLAIWAAIIAASTAVPHRAADYARYGWAVTGLLLPAIAIVHWAIATQAGGLIHVMNGVLVVLGAAHLAFAWRIWPKNDAHPAKIMAES